MLSTLNPQDAFRLEIAHDVINEHTADGHCTAQSPCVYVKNALDTIETLEVGGTTAILGATDVQPEYDPNRARPAGGAKGGNQYGSFQVRHASEPQKRFATKLLGERVVPTTGGEQRALQAFRAGTANLRQTTDLISWLLTLPEIANKPVRVVSEKQVALIIKLAAEKDGGQDIVDLILESVKVATVAELPIKAGSSLITTLFALERKPVELVEHRSGKLVAKTELEDGVYKVGAEFFKVQFNKEGTRLYAKHLVNISEDGKLSWEYAGAPQRHGIKPEHKLTLEEAKAFGKLTGTCIDCGRTLTNEDSIEAGIGPICAAKYGA